MKKAAFILIFVQLVSCVTFQTIDKGLKDLNNRNISEAFNILGYPDRKEVFGNETVYYWTTTCAASDGSALNCKIVIGTDQNGAIVKTSYEGQWGACERFAYRFDSVAGKPGKGN